MDENNTGTGLLNIGFLVFRRCFRRQIFLDSSLDARSAVGRILRLAQKTRSAKKSIPMNSEPKTPDIAEQLAKLAKLHVDGALSDEEFKTLKATLISQISDKPTRTAGE